MDTGIGFVQPMFFVGVVEDRDDPRAEGRVKVRAFGVHGSNRDIPTTDLPWATLIIGSHDVNFTPPPLNAWVFGFFIDGRDAQQPMILGLIPSQSNELVNPEVKGWGTVPAENYDLLSQGTRPKDLGLSPMSKLATGEFLNETYNEALETNRVKDIPIAGGCARNHYPLSAGNLWGNDIGESYDTGAVSTRATSATEKQIYDGLIARGLNDAQAKGIIANMIKESGLNPGINEIAPLVKGSRGGFGLIQWTGPRRRALEAAASARGVSVSDIDFQLDYLMEELRGPERRSYNNLLRTNDPVEAARIFSEQNLRPGIPRLDLRLAEARRLGQIDLGGGTNQPIVGQTSDSSAQSTNPNEPTLARAEEIRIRIAEIDKQIETEKDPDKIKQLVDERKTLEAELAALESSGPVEGNSGDPYSGYNTPSADTACATTWSEPPSGYSAKYPYNRVIETASGHSIELDDTPGGERIMIWHRDGSYIQITGPSTSVKNMGDKYEINERNNHVYIGGNNIITIEGDSHVLIKGNKVEEIVGDYKQIVHGNIMVGGAGRVEINGADRTDIRSASLGLDSNVENLNIRTGKNIVFESGETINLKSKNIRIGASENMSVTGEKALFLQAVAGDLHLKSKGNAFLNPEQNLYLRTEGGSVAIQSEGPLKMNSAGSFVSLSANSYMSLGAENNMNIASKGGSVNLNASENMGLSGKMTYMKGESVNISATAGQTNIGASSDITIDSSGGKLFAQASGDVNVKSGAAAKIQSTGNMSIKGHTTYLEGSGNVNIKAGGFAYMSAGIVFIDDEVQLASGASASGAFSADSGNEVKTKEEIQPSKFDDTVAENPSGDVAGQAQAGEAPTAAQSAATGPAAPPDRHPPTLSAMAFTLDDVTGIAPAFGPQPLRVEINDPIISIDNVR